MEVINLNSTIECIGMKGRRRWLIGALTTAFIEARKGKRKTFNEHAFDVRWGENVIKLADAIMEWNYRPSGSISFVVREPMVREIFAAPFVDRVVHHFLYRMQGGWWDRRMLNSSYSCREGKGTLYAIQDVQRMMRKASEGFQKPAYYIKLDIKSHFMSLPRQALYERIQWGLKEQFKLYKDSRDGRWLYQICDFLWRQVLLDDPASKSRRRGPQSDWDILPPEKSLYTQPKGQGIVIGNLTSQLASNIYLDQLDRFMKFELGCKFIGRYVDDFIRIVPALQYERAKRDVKAIEEFLEEKLKLTLHPYKRQYQSIYKGVEFVGARIYPHCLYPSDRLQRNFERAMYAISKGKMVDNATIISYFGLLKHLNASKYIRSVLTKYGLNVECYNHMKWGDSHPGCYYDDYNRNVDALKSVCYNTDKGGRHREHC